MVRDLSKLSRRGRELVLVDLPARGRQLVLVDLPARGRQIVRYVPKPVQLHLQRVSKRSLKVSIEIFAGLLVVGAVALGLAYERVNRGPISMAFLVPSIENAINRELADLEVQIDDAVLQKSDEGAGVRFRLRNIRLVDAHGAVVAQAPLAAIGLSGSALLWGRIAPGSVDFIGPRMLLFYTPERGLALTFSREAEAAPAGQSALSGLVPTPEPVTPTGMTGRQIDITKTVTTAFERARGGDGASSYLTRFGVRDAVVIFDQNGKQSYWQVPDFAVDLQHGDALSVLAGEAEINSAAGPWQLQFRTEQSNAKQQLTFTALVQDLIPTGLAANFPGLEVLRAMNLPVSGETTVEMSTSGEVLGAEAQLRVAGGQITPPWDVKHPMQLDKGDLHMRYLADEDRIEVLPSTVQWGRSRITVSGEFRPVASDSGPKRWQFRLQADDAVLEAEEFGLAPLKIDQWFAEGTLSPDAGWLELSRFSVRAGNAAIELAGMVTDAPDSPAVHLQGRISPMPLAVLKQLWPKFIAGGAREWVGERVSAGYVSGGAVEINFAPGQLAELKAGGDVPEEALALDLDATGLEIHYIPDMPPIQTVDARLRIRGRQFVMDVPEGWVTLPSGKRIALKEGALNIDDLREDPQQGQITFKATSGATAMAELLDHEPLGYVKTLGRTPGDISGRAEADFLLSLPMAKWLTFDDIKMRGEVQLADAAVKSGLDDLKIQNGSITFNVTEQALQATGDVVVKGVPAKLSWQRFFDAPDDRQPDLRLSLMLTEADRKRLGADINHLLRGPVPTVISIGQGGPGKKDISVQANLSDADVVVSHMGWRKRPGQTATLRFRRVDMPDGGKELQDFRIVGDDIAINGWIALDAQEEPTAFYFDDFSFNLITHMEIAGKLKPSNIWDVQVSGSSYDGRQFFKSLFSSGQLADSRVESSESGSNLDLTAQFGTMVGHFDTTVQDVSIRLKKRGGLLYELDAKGQLNGRTPIAARLEPTPPGQPRVILAESADAGSAFRLVGFYPQVEGGEASLQVNLEAEAAASTSGTLWARDFVILGDRVVGEVLSTPDGRRVPQRQRIVFNQLKAPFSVGGGRFVLHDSYINGPLLGATLRGNVDFAAQQVDLGGTYVPLYGLNSALGSIPIIGNLLVGRRGEGVVGITFAVQGPTSDPNVLVNPVSVVAPGIFRQIFEFNGQAARAMPRVPSAAQQARQAPFRPGG